MDSQVEMLMEFFLDTINRCGTHLLNKDDTEIEYQIFEEIDIGIITFLHEKNLTILKDADCIDDDIFEKCTVLRQLFLELQNTTYWNVSGIKESPKWRSVLELADGIKRELGR